MRAFIHALRVRHYEGDRRTIEVNANLVEHVNVALTESRAERLGSYEDALEMGCAITAGASRSSARCRSVARSTSEGTNKLRFACRSACSTSTKPTNAGRPHATNRPERFRLPETLVPRRGRSIDFIGPDNASRG